MIFSSLSFVRFFLHVLALILFIVSLLSGMRLAFDNPYMPTWLLEMPFVPQGNMHLWHEVSAFIWLTLLAYGLFTWLKARRQNESHLKRKNISIKLAYLIILLQCTTGLVLFINQSSLGIQAVTPFLLLVHYALAYVFLLIILVHATDQLIIKPLRAVYSMFLPKNLTLKSIITLFILGLVVLATHYFFHHLHTNLTAKFIKLEQRITIDGHFDEAQWASAEAVTVTTSQGLDYFSSVPIEVKAMHNGLSAYFAVKWPDISPSYTHIPLIKTDVGWKAKHNGFATDDEKTYYEDKFAVMLSQDPGLAGGYSVHLGKQPLPEHPQSRSGRGFHYTTDGSIRDVWHWKAVRGADMSYLDDNHFGPPSPACEACPRYKGGYRTDPKESGELRSNWTWFYPEALVPLRLPKNTELIQQAMENRYSMPTMNWYDTMPYSSAADNYPLGTEMPSVLDYDGFEGDRADVLAKAVWKNGFWHLEMSRDLVTSSSYDLIIEDNIYLWFVAFNHAQSRHSYHLKPLKLILEKATISEAQQ